MPVKAIFEVLKLLYEKIIHFDIDSRAAAVAFNFTLAVFPTVIFLFTLIPYIPIKNLDLQILNFMEDILPKGIFAEVRATIIDITSKRRSGVLSLGFIIAIYASTAGMMSLMRTFNLTYRTAENRGIIKQRLVALFLNFLLTSILFLAILILIVGHQIIDIFFERGVGAVPGRRADRLRHRDCLGFIALDILIAVVAVYRPVDGVDAHRA